MNKYKSKNIPFEQKGIFLLLEIEYNLTEYIKNSGVKER